MINNNELRETLSGARFVVNDENACDQHSAFSIPVRRGSLLERYFFFKRIFSNNSITCSASSTLPSSSMVTGTSIRWFAMGPDTLTGGTVVI